MSLVEKEAYAELLEEKLRIKMTKIAYYDRCVIIEIAATLVLNQFQAKYTRVMINRSTLLQEEEDRLIAAKTKAWNDRFAAESDAYPPTIEDVLWIVAKNGYTDLVAKLINLSKFTRMCQNLQPVMREVRNKRGMTQLHYFCMKGMIESVMRMLEMRSIDVEARDNRGWSCLTKSAQSGYHFISKLLLQNGALVDSINNDGLVPLNYAVVNGNFEVFVLLCQFGADLNSRNRNIGWSPFQRAIWYGHLPIVKELYSRGVNINSSDHLGQTALTMARELGRKDIEEFLIEHGAIS